MNLRDTPEEAQLRAELRSWLAQHKPAGLDALITPAALRDLEDHAPARAWSAKLAEQGYAGLTWPVEYGGRGAPTAHYAVMLEEFARAEAPHHLGVIGLGIAGPTLIAHASDEMRASRLPAMLRADEIWCQGFSEPGAGSDLANVRTRAVEQGDVFVVNGQKIWSSFAQLSDWCLLLTRTEAGSQGHKGLTMLMVDMRTPGIEVRPITEATGDAVFNEIFFTDVEVPVANVLLEMGAGWKVAMTALMHERATLGSMLVSSLDAQLRRVTALARERGVEDPLLLDRLVREWVELQALKLTNKRALSQLSASGVPGPEGSVTKLRWSESNQRLMALALELFGAAAPVAEEEWRFQALRSRANSIEAGTSQVLRNIVAERVLGLPRSR